MSDQRSLSDLTREQLYELVWSMPGTKVAAQFGVSDVAVFKHCKKLGIPRPERGYWAQLEFGKKVSKPELPPLPPSPAELFAREAQKPIPASNLPVDAGALHPVATAFMAALKNCKVSYDKHRVHLRTPEFPEADISKDQAPRAAGAFHALLAILEPRGVLFKKSRSKYDGGCFRKGNDDLHLKVEEELIDKPESPGRRKNYYTGWQQQDNKVPSGRLTFTLKRERYGGQEKRWQENEKTSLETIVAEMAREVCRHYTELQKQRAEETIRQEKARIEWAIQRKKQEEEEAIRRTEEAKRKHAETLEQTARTRQEDLLKAAEWWRIYRSTEEFIAECERRWREAQGGALTAEQEAWLPWAREVAKGVSPFETGYPDPARDGAFDAAAVPFGGPYPDRRKFPQPSTMPEIPAPVVVQQSYGAPSYHSEPKPYPFWLKYQRR